MGKIAYFSMEIGVDPNIPTYCGGLGVLAGDTLIQAATDGIEMVGVTLLYNEGYFKQGFYESGWQFESKQEWNPHECMKKLDKSFVLKIHDRNVKVSIWEYLIKGENVDVPVYFLDTNNPENHEGDIDLTSHLYFGNRYFDKYYARICQEKLLGVGGIKALRLLDYKDEDIDVYHINEGHGSFAVLELLLECGGDEEYVKSKCVFTTHTPVIAGHDRFDYWAHAHPVLEDVLPENIRELAGQNDLCMTKLGMSLSNYKNAVSKEHKKKSEEMFVNQKIDYITNGVNARWVCDEFKELYNKYAKEWCKNPMILNSIEIPNNELFEAHNLAKKKLFKYIEDKLGEKLNPRALTIGSARRFTGYKQNHMILWKLNKLEQIVEKAGNDYEIRPSLQLIFSGKAHPEDDEGKRMLQYVINCAQKESCMCKDANLKIIFIPDYDMNIGKLMTSGVDVWLNTPKRPREASGTSGMKAAFNGVPHLSTLDGWWLEGINVSKEKLDDALAKKGYVISPTGWAFEEDEGLLKVLEDDIMPTYYENRPAWINIMKNAITMNASYFNTKRMLNEYVEKAYKIKGRGGVA